MERVRNLSKTVQDKFPLWTVQYDCAISMDNRWEKMDLISCDREPLHLIGGIQSFYFTLAGKAIAEGIAP